MLCMQAIEQQRVMRSIPDEPISSTPHQEDQAAPAHLQAQNPVIPQAEEMSSYFPRRILGYLSYEDDAESPADE